MKKVVALVAALALFSSTCFAECDFSTGAVRQADGTYQYTKECHIKVGELVQGAKIKDEQIQDYKKAIELKDLTIQKADQRTQLWIDTSMKLEDNIQKIQSYRGRNEWIYFGLGALTVFAAGMAAAQLTGRR